MFDFRNYLFEIIRELLKRIMTIVVAIPFRNHFPSILLIIVGLSLFTVQCNDKMLNPSAPDTVQSSNPKLLPSSNVATARPFMT